MIVIQLAQAHLLMAAPIAREIVPVVAVPHVQDRHHPHVEVDAQEIVPAVAVLLAREIAREVADRIVREAVVILVAPLVPALVVVVAVQTVRGVVPEHRKLLVLNVRLIVIPIAPLNV